jgi:dihydroxy-acid dehydratase
MAAGRFNIPTILVIGGYQPSGHYQGKHVDIEEVFIGSVQAMFGKLSYETLAGMCDSAIGGPGVCAGMSTANSMHIACEALS